MAKYDAKFKLKVVKYVLEEKHGVKAAKKTFGLHSHGDIVKWVNKYIEHGEKGLVRNNFKYDIMLKMLLWQNIVFLFRFERRKLKCRM